MALIILDRHEVLPGAVGVPHFVDPDTDVFFGEHPVSLCGTALITRDGQLAGDVCEVCKEVAAERDAL